MGSRVTLMNLYCYSFYRQLAVQNDEGNCQSGNNGIKVLWLHYLAGRFDPRVDDLTAVIQRSAFLNLASHGVRCSSDGDFYCILGRSDK